MYQTSKFILVGVFKLIILVQKSAFKLLLYSSDMCGEFKVRAIRFLSLGQCESYSADKYVRTEHTYHT